MKLNYLATTLAIALIWAVLYSLNHYLFKITEVTPWASLIFIPSGFKMACVAIYRLRSVLGLFLGSIMTGYIFLGDFSFVDVAMFSVFSSLLPFATLVIVERFLPIHASLVNLSIEHILSFAVVYSILNGFFHTAYRYHVLFFRDVHGIKAFISMAVGDFFGILLFVYFLPKFIRYLYMQIK